MSTLQEAIEYIQSCDPRGGERKLAIVLGSGWGPLVDALIDIEGEVAYENLPGFPVSTVEGHAGRLIWGSLGGAPIYCMQGRLHYYEGYTMEEITFPVRVFASLGVEGILLTNAAGGISGDLKVGSLMMITDHINFMGSNPLRGPNHDEFGPRFPDMTSAWDTGLQSSLREAAKAASVRLHSGVYVAVSGPSFETPAEIRAFAGLGADAVGMSTVPECIVARHCGLRVAGISCITNAAAHTGGGTLSHEDVSRAAKQSIAEVVALFFHAVPLISDQLQIR
ncbi:MAG: purine-nucleoside phosphorylase [Opitutales bacterium]|jgi:purine-nucleoside phosphorylase